MTLHFKYSGGILEFLLNGVNLLIVLILHLFFTQHFEHWLLFDLIVQKEFLLDIVNFRWKFVVRKINIGRQKAKTDESSKKSLETKIWVFLIIIENWGEFLKQLFIFLFFIGLNFQNKKRKVFLNQRRLWLKKQLYGDSSFSLYELIELILALGNVNGSWKFVGLIQKQAENLISHFMNF